MNEKKAKKLIKKVQLDYDKIADHFSNTRKYLWPEMKDWQGYVKNGQKVLDAGCGSGRLLELFKDNQIEYEGIDISAKLINIAKSERRQYNQKNIHFQVGNLLFLPYENKIFDLIFCVSTLQHIPSRENRFLVLKEILRVLKPGGRVFFTNWYFWNNYTNKKYLIKKQTLVNWIKGFEKGDIFIPWRSPNGDLVVNRYYHAFKKPEIKELFSNLGFVLEKNYIIDRGNSNKQVESLVTIVKKPKQ